MEPTPIVREAWHSRSGGTDRRRFYVTSEVGVDPRIVLERELHWGSEHPWERSHALAGLTIVNRLTPTTWLLDALYSPHVAGGRLAQFDSNPTWESGFPFWQCAWKGAGLLALLQVAMWVVEAF